MPDYQRDSARIELPAHHRDAWSTVTLPPQLVNAAPLRRAYSLALPVEKCDGQLTLLVRFMPGAQPGKGAGFMYTLKEGDRVQFSGAFGDFAIKPGGREKVFIGGGAGMAPLRAMIHALLDAGAREPMQFWYGARSHQDAPYVDEMKAFSDKHPNFRWRWCGPTTLAMRPMSRSGWCTRQRAMHCCASIPTWVRATFTCADRRPCWRRPASCYRNLESTASALHSMISRSDTDAVRSNTIRTQAPGACAGSRVRVLPRLCPTRKNAGL